MVGIMRIILALLGALMATAAAAADPECTINERAGPFTPIRGLEEQIVRMTLPAGTKVEIITMTVDQLGCPFALVREPGVLYTDYGWADVRHITCR